MSIWLQAVAGSGKTTSIINLIEQLTGGILCLSFTRSAVSRMREKIQSKQVIIETIHSFAAQLTRANLVTSRVLKDAAWQMIWEADKENFTAVFSESWQNRVEAGAEQSEWRDLYQQLKRSFNVMSYDDLLEILSVHSEHEFDHIFIDEAQDLTEAQWRIIMKLAATYPNATLNVVGDANQIIYAFQGSSNLIWEKQLLWWKHLPGTREYKVLNTCYRCGSKILDLVNKLFNPEHLCANPEKASFVEIREPIKELQVYLEWLTCYIKSFDNPDEVLILVKRRGVLSRAIIKKFHQEGIEVSGLTDSGMTTNARNYQELLHEGNSQLIHLAAEYVTQSLGNYEDFLETLQSQPVSVEVVPNHVRLLTIHSAKGLEAKYVIIADAYDSPYKMVTDREKADRENRNLLYVAMTRAQTGLVFSGYGSCSKGSFGDLVREFSDTRVE
jgi:ATP-dependent exoDNAse (exonuclease V) beta subunit